jgi:hypothetical protein
MRKKPPSFDTARVNQLRDVEQRLEELLGAEERRIAALACDHRMPGKREDAHWLAKTMLFEICVKVSLRRSKDIRAFLATGDAALKPNDVPPRKPAGRTFVLSVLGDL